MKKRHQNRKFKLRKKEMITYVIDPKAVMSYLPLGFVSLPVVTIAPIKNNLNSEKA